MTQVWCARIRAPTWTVPVKTLTRSQIADDHGFTTGVAHQLRRDLQSLGIISRKGNSEFFAFVFERSLHLRRVHRAERAHQPGIGKEFRRRESGAIVLHLAHERAIRFGRSVARIEHNLPAYIILEVAPELRQRFIRNRKQEHCAELSCFAGRSDRSARTELAHHCRELLRMTRRKLYLVSRLYQDTADRSA